MPRFLVGFLAGLGVLCAPSSASAELLLDGSEFQVNTYTTGLQGGASCAVGVAQPRRRLRRRVGERRLERHRHL